MATDTLSRIPQAIHDEVTTNDLFRTRHNVYRGRRQLYPAMSKNIEEAQTAIDAMDPTKLTTSCGKFFVLANNKNRKIIIFSTDKNIRVLSECDTIFVYGTFDYSPKHFKQLFTIHGLRNNQYIETAFCLLPDKRKTTYCSMFNILREKRLGVDVEFESSTVIADFEQAIHIAVKTFWSEAKIIGCRFHLTQAWFRHIQSLGTYYKEC